MKRTRTRPIRSALRTEGRFARSGRRSAAGKNNGDLTQARFKRGGRRT